MQLIKNQSFLYSSHNLIKILLINEPANIHDEHGKRETLFSKPFILIMDPIETDKYFSGEKTEKNSP